MSSKNNDVRCVKSVRCQVTVGELYRWILAKLSDKDIKRALHKYRDLMPRQSDWNRKLTQATNVPEIGFRYLYRCGQIDESNHRTMQKMLKYIDRQDVLPYFDTILYNTNMSNASYDQLCESLRDNLIDYVSQCDASEFNKTIIGEPYIISQCQPVKNLRLTRSLHKRLSSGECSSCLTYVKKLKLDAPNVENIDQNQSTSDKTKIKLSTYELNEMKLKKELTTEGFSNKIFTALRQSRQRHRNTPMLNQYSLPGVIETPVQLLLHSSSYVDKSEVDELTEAYILENQNGTNETKIDESTTNDYQKQSLLSESTENTDEQCSRTKVYNCGGNTSKKFNEMSSSREKELTPGFFYAKLKIRIRSDCMIDLTNIQSNRSDELDRQMHILRQTFNHIRDTEPAEVICEVQCTDVHQVDMLWRDYLNGTLKKHINEMYAANRRRINNSTQPRPSTNQVDPAQDEDEDDEMDEEDDENDDADDEEDDSVLYFENASLLTSSSASIFSATSTSNFPYRNKPPMTLHVYINKHEYVSCRTLLMRNLYPMFVYQNTPSSITTVSNTVSTSAPLTVLSIQGNLSNNNVSTSSNNANRMRTNQQTQPQQQQQQSYTNQNNREPQIYWSNSGSTTTPVITSRLNTNSSIGTPIVSTPIINSSSVVSTNQNSSIVTATNQVIATAQRFSAVQHLIAHLRDVPQMNMWSVTGPTTTNTISASPASANTVLDHGLFRNQTLVPPSQVAAPQFYPTTSTSRQLHHSNATSNTQSTPTQLTGTAPQISVANRPVLMHMIYPHESYIPFTVNPLLRPIQVISSNTTGTNSSVATQHATFLANRNGPNILNNFNTTINN